MTTIDPDTGIKEKDVEPLKMLRKLVLLVKFDLSLRNAPS